MAIYVGPMILVVPPDRTMAWLVYKSTTKTQPISYGRLWNSVTSYGTCTENTHLIHKEPNAYELVVHEDASQQQRTRQSVTRC